jgi:anti-sigma factor RsiW
MSAYIDNELNEVDKAKFEKHIAQCPKCKEEYELLLDVVSECSNIDEVELPEDFREELHNKLLLAKESKSRGLSGFIGRKKWMVYGGATAAAAVLIFALSLNALNAPKSAAPMAKSAAPSTTQSIAQSTAPNTTTQYTKADTVAPSQDNISKAVAPKAPDVTPAPKALVGSVERSNIVVTTVQPPSRDTDTRITGFAFNGPAIDAGIKIIKNGNIALKVPDVQGRIDELTALAAQLGGHVENSSVTDVSGNPIPVVPQGGVTSEKTTKVGSITLRLPSDKFDSAFQSILAMGTVENQNTNTSDITKEYMDLESRMNNLKLQEKTYQDLLAKTKNVDETLKVENEINRIRTEIDIMQGDIKRWNDQVEYSTIVVNLTEVKEAELEKVDTSSVWHRARRGLINALNNIKNGIAWIFVFIVSVLPYLIILGVGSLLAVYWIRRNRKLNLRFAQRLYLKMANCFI